MNMQFRLYLKSLKNIKLLFLHLVLIYFVILPHYYVLLITSKGYLNTA